jgi:hypothetical protein
VNTKLVMTLSSVFLAVAGTMLLFAPVEISAALGESRSAQISALLQLAGALYLAFALTNWTAKGSMIGGIYSRPLSLGNLLHFMVGAIVLFKHALSQGPHWGALVALAIYASFALLFSFMVLGRGSGARPGQPSQRAL